MIRTDAVQVILHRSSMESMVYAFFVRLTGHIIGIYYATSKWQMQLFLNDRFPARLIFPFPEALSLLIIKNAALFAALERTTGTVRNIPQVRE